MREYVIKEGTVVLIENASTNTNETSGMRIKVRLTHDGNVSIDKLPWCFPLLPKMIQTAPKIGECVLIITSQLSKNESNRFYIGPVISQPQFMENAPYCNGVGPACSLLQNGNKSQVEKNITTNPYTTGAFPNSDEVALIGRTSEDIILKEGEIDLRCGIRTDTFGDNELKGKVLFNSLNPSYIQMKFKNNMATNRGQEASSIINLVADRINLISNQDTNMDDLIHDNKSLIDVKSMDKIMEQLHQLPYGDILVKYLKIMQNAILTHGHNFGPEEPPIMSSNIMLLNGLDFDKILSDKVRIS